MSLFSVWRFCHCAARFAAQHQCCRGIPFRRLQRRCELSYGLGVGSPANWDFLQAVRSQVTEAQKIAGGSGSEQDIAEAKIELEVSKLLYLISLANCMTMLHRFWKVCRLR